MKKALFTLAVLGAASGAAMAQSSSSVTLYGVADIAIGKSTAAGNTKWGAQSNSIVTNGTSRIGLTGKEDLGGGLWAGFRYEGQVSLATGETPTNVWSREANVQLGSSSWGTVKLGRSTSPGFDGQGVYELTKWANYSLIATTYGWGANPTNRTSAQIEYKTPSLSGLSAEIAYVPKANGNLILDNPAGVGVPNQSDRWSANIVYSQGPIAAAITYDKANHTQDTKTSTASQTDKANYTLGGSYKFGDTFVLAASYNHANDARSWRFGNKGSVVGGRRYGYTLGGSVFLDAFTITLDLSRDTTNDIYSGKKYTNGLLEAKYSLSKRTSLYADYLRLDGTNNYSLGLRHNF